MGRLVTLAVVEEGIARYLRLFGDRELVELRRSAATGAVPYLNSACCLAARRYGCQAVPRWVEGGDGRDGVASFNYHLLGAIGYQGGDPDLLRCRRLLPLIEAEIDRRIARLSASGQVAAELVVG